MFILSRQIVKTRGAGKTRVVTGTPEAAPLTHDGMVDAAGGPR
jgi:hypothetical protein